MNLLNRTSSNMSNQSKSHQSKTRNRSASCTESRNRFKSWSGPVNRDWHASRAGTLTISRSRNDIGIGTETGSTIESNK